MQVRREKDSIRNNRLLKEKQFEESRQQEFKAALDKEAVSVVFQRETFLNMIFNEATKIVSDIFNTIW